MPTNDLREHFDTGVTNLVGQAGLGDIALTPDESRLLVVNLTTRALHQFAATAPYAELRADALPANTAACPGGPGDFRPFGVRARRTATAPLELFVAFVCSGATRASFADVRVGALGSPNNGATWALAAIAPLDTNHNDPAVASRQEERWTYWRDGDANCTASNPYAAMCPQPLATSINFLFDGRLLIGLRDRFGDMSMPVQRTEGGTTYPLGRGTGDAILLAPTGPSTWGGPVLASNGNEYLHEESYGSNLHPEPLWGALAVLPGTANGGGGQQIVSTYKAPYTVLSGGVGWFDYTGAAGGAPLTGLEEIYDDQMAATFGKTSGLGDLEPLCAWALIGDRVWLDNNGNGLQDAGEPGQPGVRLRVTQGARSVDITTNAAGNWSVFVNPFAPFRIQVVSGVPGGYIYTNANRGDDTLDSDADANGLIDQTTPVNAASYSDTSYDIGLVQPANVRIAKSGPANAQSGSTIAYTLSYANDGPAAANNVTVSDTLPAGLAFTSASPAPAAQSGQTLTWNFGQLGAGAGGTITVYASVRNGTTGNVTNVATISTSTPGDNPNDNTAQHTTLISDPPPPADLMITKSGPARTYPGGFVDYTLVYRNLGPAAAPDVYLDDIFDPSLFVSASPPPTTATSNGFQWHIGPLAAGASGTITVRFRIPNDPQYYPGRTDSNVINIAVISCAACDEDKSNNMSSVTTPVLLPNMVVSKTAPPTVNTGGQIAYTITYRNAGNGPAENVRVTDTLPNGVTLVSASPAPSGNLFWDFGTLAPGQSGTISVVVNDTFGNGAGSPHNTMLTNRVAVSTDTVETNPNDNTAQATTTVIGTNIMLVKTAPAQITVGDLITFTLRITNTSGVLARNVYLWEIGLNQQARDEGYAIVASQPPISAYFNSGDYAYEEGAPYWVLGDIAPGASKTVVVTVRPPIRTASYSFLNRAYVETTTQESNNTDNDAQSTTRIVVPDLEIVKTSAVTFPVLSGQEVRYTLDWRNLADDATARSAVISDTVPPQLSDVRWRCVSGCALSGAGNALRAALGDVAPGAKGQIEVIGTARTTQPREDFTNTATISTATPERSLANNRSSVDGAVWTLDLAVEKRATPRVRAGETFTATLAYRNAGAAPAANVVLTDTLPLGVTLVSSNPPPSSVQTPTLTWNLGALAATVSGTVELTLRADPSLADGTLARNRAAITLPPGDRDPANNSTQADTLVHALADVAVLKEVVPTTPVLAGSGVLTYTIVVTNNGPSTAASVVLTDTADAALSIVASQPAALPTWPPRWGLGDLAPGATRRITVVARTAQNAPASVRNTATVGSTTRDPKPANNTSSVDSPVIRAADVRITKVASANRVAAGSEVVYTISYLNAGPSLAEGVTVGDDVPDALSSVTWSCLSGCRASGAGNGIRIPIGALGVGEGGFIRVRGVTTPGAQPQLDVTNTATIGGITPDPNTANNTATSVTVAQTANLRIAKGGPARATAGALIRYTITVTNEGPLAAEAVQVQDVLPPYLTLVSADRPTTNGSTTSPRWLVGTLAAGESARLVLDVRVAAGAPGGTVLNTATTETTTPERRSDDNTASWPTIIDAPGTTAVTLAYLRAERTAGGAAITWQTLMEHDTAFFRLLRASRQSVQGATEVGRIDSKGSGGGTYRLTDAKAPAGPVWYWLVEVERGGAEHTYGPVAATNPTEQRVYRVYLPEVVR